MKFMERWPFEFTDDHAEAVALREYLREQDYDRIGIEFQGDSLFKEFFFKGHLRVEIDYSFYKTQPTRNYED